MSIRKSLVILFINFVFFACRSDSIRLMQDDWVYFCNAELINDEETSFLDSIHHSIHYGNVGTRSNELVFDGDFSVKLTPKKQYGFTIRFPRAKPDEYFEATVWRRSNDHKGLLVASADGFYQSSDRIIETRSDGWEKILIDFFVPINIQNDIAIYLWYNGADSAYFDDLRIERRPERIYPPTDQESAFKLYYDAAAQQKIKAKRYAAFEDGVLVMNGDDYVNSILFSDGDFYETKIRLKGDWLDHIQGDKLSFRVKTKTKYAWRGMKAFSIQTPKARNFQHEWVLHQMLQNDDLLTTRFGFIPVWINGKNTGIYAWEKHFDKQLIEGNKRRDGPIVRFDESLFWEANREYKEAKYELPVFEAAAISLFDPGRVVDEPLYQNQFLEAQSLLHQFQFRKAQVSDLFDVKRLAGYFAYNLLNKTYHGMAWHNIRFYYNPVLCRLEPISYDGGYLENVAMNDKIRFGYLRNEETIIENGESVFEYWPLRDSVYMNNFYACASKISSKTFLDKQFASMKSQLMFDESLLHEEFPYYYYTNEHIYSKANDFRSYLPKLSKMVADPEYYKRVRKIKYKPLELSDKYDDRLIGYMIHAYNRVDKQGRYYLEIENFFGDTIQVVSGKKSNDIFDQEFNHVLLVAPITEPYLAQKYRVDKAYDEVVVEIPSAKQSILLPVTPWAAPSALTSRQKVESGVSFPQTNYYNIDDHHIVFKGYVSIDKHVVIPAGYDVVFDAGTHIDLIDSATFVSYSPVFFNGTKDAPIRVESSDRSAKGFNVLQAPKLSVLHHVYFDGLSNLKFGGWTTTCAVCFYESDVDMHYVEFSRNVQCDDALNVVRSHFDVGWCRFIDTFADAFDSDFCEGTLTNSYFDHSGNDAIDFSGSQILIDACTILNSGDKGVSGGEKSDLLVTNTHIDGGNIGVASKDQSKVVLKKCELSGNVYGLAAYQKKPEYGPASIVVEDAVFRKNMFLHLIEEHSELIFNQKEIKGTVRKVAERFY